MKSSKFYYVIRHRWAWFWNSWPICRRGSRTKFGRKRSSGCRYQKYSSVKCLLNTIVILLFYLWSIKEIYNKIQSPLFCFQSLSFISSTFTLISQCMFSKAKPIRRSSIIFAQNVLRGLKVENNRTAITAFTRSVTSIYNSTWM